MQIFAFDIVRFKNHVYTDFSSFFKVADAKTGIEGVNCINVKATVQNVMFHGCLEIVRDHAISAHILKVKDIYILITCFCDKWEIILFLLSMVMICKK